MMFPQPLLLVALRRILSRTPFVSDYRKRPDGKIVRFINWNWKQKGQGK